MTPSESLSHDVVRFPCIRVGWVQLNWRYLFDNNDSGT